MVGNSQCRKSVEEKLKEENGFTDVIWWSMKLLQNYLAEEVVGVNVVGGFCWGQGVDVEYGVGRDGIWASLTRILNKDGAVFNCWAEAVRERQSFANIALAEKKYLSEMLTVSYTGGM